jgi:hypothetical protein
MLAALSTAQAWPREVIKTVQTTLQCRVYRRQQGSANQVVLVCVDALSAAILPWAASVVDGRKNSVPVMLPGLFSVGPKPTTTSQQAVGAATGVEPVPVSWRGFNSPVSRTYLKIV